MNAVIAFIASVIKYILEGFNDWKFGGKHASTNGANSPIMIDSPGGSITVNDEATIKKTIDQHLTVEDYTVDIDNMIASRLNGVKCERVGYASPGGYIVAEALLKRMLSRGIKFERDFPSLSQVTIHPFSVRVDGEIALAGVKRQFMFDNPTSILVL